jgi:uncharacterized protein (TIGR03067 family)
MNLIASFTLASIVAAPVPKADALQEAKQNFQGAWKVVELVWEGMPEEKEEVVKTTVLIKGDRMIVTFRGNEQVAVFTLDPKTDPPSIDITPLENEKPTLIKGTYKLEKNKLTICFAREDEKRPMKFESSASTKTSMLVLERAKK